MPSHTQYRRFSGCLPLLLAPVLALLCAPIAHARPASSRPAPSNPAPFGATRVDYPTGGAPMSGAPMGGPVVKSSGAASDWTGGAAPPGTPQLPGVTYANASDRPNVDPSQPPTALGQTPISLDAIRAVQVGGVRLTAPPMRVGNMDLLAPLVDTMEELGARVTKADLRLVPGSQNAPIQNDFFQINRSGQAPIILCMGQNKAWIDRNEQTLRAAPLNVGGQIYLPIFSIAPLLGAATRLDAAGVLTLTPTVESVQVFPLRDTVAVTVKTSKPLPAGLKFNSMRGADGSARLYLDFPGYSMGFDALATTNERVVSGGSGDVIRARAGMPSKFPDTTRVTLDLKRNLRGVTIESGDPTMFAFVITPPATPPTPAPTRIGNVVPSTLSGMTIVLDAGHGGYDHGAHGAYTDEKNRTLDLIQRLAANLRARGADVQLTRSTDSFVSLQGRVDHANTRRADLFISIHNNASVNRSSNGTETFYYTAQSVGLAQQIHRELAAATGCPNRGISQARFFVIRKTWMPSVLLEVAFVTNSREEKLLNSPEWCQRVADGVARGVDSYARVYHKGANG